MVLLELATQEYPYSECFGVAQIFKKVLTGVPPQALGRVHDEELLNLIKLCISYDPESSKSVCNMMLGAGSSCGLSPRSSCASLASMSISGLNRSVRRITFDSFGSKSMSNRASTTATANDVVSRHQPLRQRMSFTEGPTDRSKDRHDTAGAEPKHEHEHGLDPTVIHQEHSSEGVGCRESISPNSELCKKAAPASHLSAIPPTLRDIVANPPTPLDVTERVSDWLHDAERSQVPSSTGTDASCASYTGSTPRWARQKSVRWTDSSDNDEQRRTLSPAWEASRQKSVRWSDSSQNERTLSAGFARDGLLHNVDTFPTKDPLGGHAQPTLDPHLELPP
eukprot:gene27232-2486_t